MDIAFMLILWLALSVIVAIYAEEKGRSGGLFLLLSLVLSPIVGLVAAATTTPNTRKLEHRALRAGDARQCPICCEIVRREATRCRYCHADLPELPPLSELLARARAPAAHNTAKAASSTGARSFNRVEIAAIIGIVATGLLALYLYVS